MVIFLEHFAGIQYAHDMRLHYAGDFRNNRNNDRIAKLFIGLRVSETQICMGGLLAISKPIRRARSRGQSPRVSAGWSIRISLPSL